MEREMHGTQETYKLFLPVWYLIAVAGLYFDVWYHLVIGRDEFWTIPHIFILCGQILHTFYAWILVRDYQKNRRESLHAAYWYLGVQLLFFLGLALSWSALRLKSVLLPATILSLIFLSMGAIMSWGEASNVPRAHGTFGIPAYPFWITFFSFFIAAIAYDSTRFFRMPFVLRGAVWGGVQGGLYYSAAKLWVDWSPAGIFTMWKFFPGVFLTWDSVISFALLGAMGGGIGAWMAARLYKIIADAHAVY